MTINYFLLIFWCLLVIVIVLHLRKKHLQENYQNKVNLDWLRAEQEIDLFLEAKEFEKAENLFYKIPGTYEFSDDRYLYQVMIQTKKGQKVFTNYIRSVIRYLETNPDYHRFNQKRMMDILEIMYEYDFDLANRLQNLIWHPKKATITI